MIWPALVGYAGAALAVLAWVLPASARARRLGLAASLAFVAYGVLIGAWPLVVAAAASTVVCLVRLRGGLAAPDTSISAAVTDPGSPFLRDFLGANAIEISQSQPDYHPTPQDTFALVISRDGLPAGALVGEPAGSELLVKLDYVTPAFRDSQSARWLFGPGRSVFTDAGFNRLVASAHTSVHRNYLDMLGFRTEGSAWVLDLRA